jgi:Uma2 family endonuclease
MSVQTKNYIDPEEYLVTERAAAFKSEYYQGEVFALAGAGNNHNLITANLIGTLYNKVKKTGCSVYPSDMRLHIPLNSLYTYPDVMVVCGAKQFLDEKKDTLLNPELIIEVLSPSTVDYDRGTKFMLYRSISTLKHYILADSRSHHVEKYSKNSEGNWVLSEIRDLNTIVLLENMNLQIPLTDIYDGVEDIPTV